MNWAQKVLQRPWETCSGFGCRDPDWETQTAVSVCCWNPSHVRPLCLPTFPYLKATLCITIPLAYAPAQLWLLPVLFLLEPHGGISALVCPLHRLGTFSVSGDRLLQALPRLSSHSKTPAGQGPAYATSDLQNHLFTPSIHGLHRPLCPAVREKRALHSYAWHRIASGSISVSPSYKFCDAVTIPLSLFFAVPIVHLNAGVYITNITNFLKFYCEIYKIFFVTIIKLLLDNCVNGQFFGGEKRGEMSGWKDGYVGGLVDGQMCECWMDGCVSVWIDESMGGWLAGCVCMYGWMCVCMDGHMDGWIDGWKDRGRNGGWVSEWKDKW